MRARVLASMLVSPVVALIGCTPMSMQHISFERDPVLLPIERAPEACSGEVGPASSTRHSLDAFFDSSAVSRVLDAGWRGPGGSVLLEIDAGATPADDRWEVITDVPDIAFVRDLAGTLATTRRETPLPAGERLRVVVSDAEGPGFRAVDEFATCPARLVGDPGVEQRLSRALAQIADDDEIDRVMAVHVDALGRATGLLYTGSKDPEAVTSTARASLLASTFFRPAWVEGVAVDSWFTVADGNLGEGEYRTAALPERVRRRATFRPRPGSAPIGVQSGGLIPCGGTATGGSQFSLMCRLNVATGAMSIAAVDWQLYFADRLQAGSGND